jgi:ABC-type spermidine/putrescine transport system permease subunit I
LLPARRSRWSGPALLLIPGLLFLIVMFLYPLAGLTGRSFTEEGVLTAEHYERMVAVPAYSKVLLNTIRMAVLVTLLCLVLGYPLAYRLVTAPSRWKLVLLIGILVPFWTSLLVRSYGWMVILHPQGLLNTFLMRLGVIDQPLELVHNTTGVLIGMTQIMLPYMVLPVAAVMERMDRALVPAARGLGASPWKSFVWVFLPLSLPGRQPARLYHQPRLLRRPGRPGRDRGHPHRSAHSVQPEHDPQLGLRRGPQYAPARDHARDLRGSGPLAQPERALG